MEREGVMVVVLLVAAVAFGRGGAERKVYLEERGRGEKQGAKKGIGWDGI